MYQTSDYHIKDNCEGYVASTVLVAKTFPYYLAQQSSSYLTPRALVSYFRCQLSFIWYTVWVTIPSSHLERVVTSPDV